MRDRLRHGAVGDSESAGLLAVVQLVGAQLTETNLLPLRDRNLGDDATENQLPGGIDPMGRQRCDDLTPNPRFESVQLRRRFRTTLTGDQRNDNQGSG
jgi:hypothetical protein